MYVQIIIFLHMIISLKSHIYLTGWNERIGGRRVGAGRDLSRVLFPYIVPIDFRAFSLLAVSAVAPAELFPPSRRRNRASDFTYISEMRAFRYSISAISPRGAHYSAALVVSRARYEISSKTRYNLSFSVFFSVFSPFALNIISSLKSLLYRFFFLPPFVRPHILRR